jgi:[ribosomal protein S18]-alanine N-acetyltransferase
MNSASTEPNISHRIRNAESSHVADMMRIARETNLSHWSAQSYLDEMRNPEAIMLRLIAEDNSLTGFVVGRLVKGGLVDTHIDGEIYNIAVTADKQRNGFGQILLDAFLVKCYERSANQVWLEVRQSNRKAIRFYEKNGFEHVQTRNHFYENPREHALLMRLDLENREG